MVRTTVAAFGFLGAFAVVSIQVPQFFAVSYDATAPAPVPESVVSEVVTAEEPVTPVVDDRPVVAHVPLPKQVKNIYMTSCVAGTPSFRADLIELIEETEINSVIIDIKDYSGTISYPTELAAWKPAWQNARCGTRDMRELVALLHRKGVFVIARITVFQDPFYTQSRPDLAVKKADGVTVWKDYKGLSFIDVAAKEYWDYIVALSAEVYNLGFDELNFDYVRYPSDGPMNDIAFPHSMAGEYGADKQANLEAFFKYLSEQLDDEELFAAYRHENTGRASSTPWTSADLFGMTTTNTDDLSIGQVIERAAPYFDFIAPMVYPSHYPDSFLGLGDPNDYPYKVVNYAMRSGVERMIASTTLVQGFLHEKETYTNASGTVMYTGKYTKPVYDASKLRTWIQDFDYGGDYDAADVRAQIQASYDAGVDSWMVWAPSNRYTRAAFKSAAENDVSSQVSE
tara:strand:- start:1478 stop:2842 length:1365 start_codon:yes stop_codon:yes gene_type:complete